MTKIIIQYPRIITGSQAGSTGLGDGECRLG